MPFSLKNLASSSWLSPRPITLPTKRSIELADSSLLFMRALVTMLVPMWPGCTQCICTVLSFISLARHSVKPRTANLAVWYTDCRSRAIMPKIEDVLTSAASGRCFRWGKKARLELITACRLILNTQSQSLSDRSSKVESTVTPALLNTRSTQPCSAITLAGRASMAALSATSRIWLETLTG